MYIYIHTHAYGRTYVTHTPTHKKRKRLTVRVTCSRISVPSTLSSLPCPKFHYGI